MKKKLVNIIIFLMPVITAAAFYLVFNYAVGGGLTKGFLSLKQLQVIEDAAKTQKITTNMQKLFKKINHQAIWPTSVGRIIASFADEQGQDEDGMSLHKGIDIAGYGDEDTVGRPVYALGDGTVVEVGSGSMTGYYIAILYDNIKNAPRLVMCMNLGPIDGLKKGDRVKFNQQIGSIGEAVNGGEACLHLQLYAGTDSSELWSKDIADYENPMSILW